MNVVDTLEVNLADIEFSYSESAMNILNNGHTIQVNYDGGSSIVYNGTSYDLKQFHFHHPSEHSINGELARWKFILSMLMPRVIWPWSV